MRQDDVLPLGKLNETSNHFRQDVVLDINLKYVFFCKCIIFFHWSQDAFFGQLSQIDDAFISNQ